MMRSACARISASRSFSNRTPSSTGNSGNNGCGLPRLGEPANEYGITGFQKQQLDGVPEVLDALQDAGQVGKEDPFPDVDAERDIFDFATLLMTQLDEGGKQRRRKIINAEVPDVLEAFQRVRLPRSR